MRNRSKSGEAEFFAREYQSAGPIPLSTVLQEEFVAVQENPPKQPKFEADMTETERIRKHFEMVHNPETPPLNALCLSGGGIRSASFALGVIQSLAKKHLLPHFHYLSSVSGGGYAAGWLSAWVHRHPKGWAGVCNQLKNGKPADKNCGASEPEEIVHLREYSNYLTPKLGVLSLDTWTLAATYIRNLLLNWLVMIPLLLGILLVPYALQAFMWLPVSVNVTASFMWVAIALSVASLIIAVLALPSLDHPPGGPRAADTETASRRPGKGLIISLVVVPMTVAGYIWSLRSAWPNAYGTITPAWLTAKTTLIWAVAGVFTYVVARWVLQKANPPSFIKCVFGFSLFGFVGIVSSIGLRTSGLLSGDTAMLCFGVPLRLGIFLLMLTVFVGYTSRDASPRADDDREWWGRLMGALFYVIIVWLAVTCIAHYSIWVVRWIGDLKYGGKIAGAITVLSGIIGVLGAYTSLSGEDRGEHKLSRKERFAKALPALCSKLFVLAVFVLLAAGIHYAFQPAVIQTVATADRALGKLQGWGLTNLHLHDVRFYTEAEADLAAKVVAATVVAEKFALFGQTWTRDAVKTLGIKKDRPTARLNAFWTVLGITAGMFGVLWLMGRFVNVNRLSLHAMYRNRLMRAFLGASNTERCPDPFTGFDPADNLPMHHLARLAHFTREELLSDVTKGPDGKRALTLTNRRIIGLVEFWQKPYSDVARYGRKQLESDSSREYLLNVSCTDCSDWEIGSREGERRINDVLTHLNSLVTDVHLAANSPHAAWLGDDPVEESKLPKVPEDLPIYRAARQLSVDGRPNLLNRLILERHCKEWLKPAAKVPRPLHVVNMALNLVHGKNLAWQQRKAASFTVSPLHSGFVLHAETNPNDMSKARRGGYRPSAEYGGGITLGTAMAISGAAASPSMGYHSSPAVTFLMTLFNARLGWWLGNPAGRAATSAWQQFTTWLGMFPGRTPRHRDAGSWKLASPKHTLSPLINEAFGLTSHNDEYVYLSDGGHFENLGLYEMVRRRCRFIVVCDAGCDPKCTFDDLGNAVRKIRTDLGIPIRLDDVDFRYGANRTAGGGKYCAVGLIDYAAVDGKGVHPGLLIYVKAALADNMPIDVYNYSRTQSEFPHEPTRDQWFSESQFESYRRLGEDCIDVVCSGELGGACRKSWEEPSTKELEVSLPDTDVRTFVLNAREHAQPEPNRVVNGQARSSTGRGGRKRGQNGDQPGKSAQAATGGAAAGGPKPGTEESQRPKEGGDPSGGEQKSKSKSADAPRQEPTTPPPNAK